MGRGVLLPGCEWLAAGGRWRSHRPPAAIPPNQNLSYTKPMEFSGTVIHGDAYGRTIGYPTLNLDAADYKSRGLKLVAGVYAGEVAFSNQPQKYQAALVISYSEDLSTPKLEAHLFDFSADCYGQTVQFIVRDFIRPYQAYDSEKALIAAIESDITKIKAILQ